MLLSAQAGWAYALPCLQVVKEVAGSYRVL